MQHTETHQARAPLRLGVPIAEPLVSAPFRAFLQWAETQPTLEVVYLPAAPVAKNGWFSSLLLRGVHALESRKFAQHPLHADATLAPIARTDSADDALDIILDVGLCEISPELAAKSRLGVLRLHMDGLREVLHREDSSGFTLQHISPSGQISVVAHGQFVTQFYYLLNRAALEAKSLAYLKRVLLRIAQHGTVPAGVLSAPNGVQVKAPTALEMLHYIVAQTWRLVLRRYRHTILREKERWGVAFAAASWQTLDFAAAKRIPNPPQHFLADPFAVEHAGAHYCFVENYDDRAGKGVISVYRLSEQGAEPLGVALAEPFHLSFPYVFQVDDTYYMCPETAQNNDIRLYECVEFPLKWKLSRVLMRDVQAVDTLLFKSGESWWLCTTQDSSGCGDRSAELYLYYADTLHSDHWTPHAQNPVVVDARKGRNGGILYDGETIYRVAQAQGFDRYGKAASVQRIVTLTPDVYAEEELRRITPDFFRNLCGTHHFHSDGNYSVFDFCEVTRL